MRYLHVDLNVEALMSYVGWETRKYVGPLLVYATEVSDEVSGPCSLLVHWVNHYGQLCSELPTHKVHYEGVIRWAKSKAFNEDKEVQSALGLQTTMRLVTLV